MDDKSIFGLVLYIIGAAFCVWAVLAVFNSPGVLELLATYWPWAARHAALLAILFVIGSILVIIGAPLALAKMAGKDGESQRDDRGALGTTIVTGIAKGAIAAFIVVMLAVAVLHFLRHP